MSEIMMKQSGPVSIGDAVTLAMPGVVTRGIKGDPVFGIVRMVRRDSNTIVVGCNDVYAFRKFEVPPDHARQPYTYVCCDGEGGLCIDAEGRHKNALVVGQSVDEADSRMEVLL